MNRVSLHLVDYTFQRKIKPVQNLSLVVAGVLWIILLPLLFLNSPSLTRLAIYLMLFSILPISIFFLLSIPFLLRNRVGKAFLLNDELIIKDDSYRLDRIQFKLNIDQSTWEESTKNFEQKLKSLPKWGNYIYLDSRKKIEFEPHREILHFIDPINIKGYDKRPTLLVQTNDLLKSILSMLWAAS